MRSGRWQQGTGYEAVDIEVDCPVAIPAGVLAATLAGASPDAASTNCGVVSVARLDSSLGIDAVHVTATHPNSKPDALICSYYGNTGRAANGATVNYVPAATKSFAALEVSLAASHKINPYPASSRARTATSSARSATLRTGRPEPVQIFAMVSLVRLEALARSLPLLSSHI